VNICFIIYCHQKQLLCDLQNKIQATIEGVQLERNKQTEFYLPGYILHITENKDDR